MIRYQLGDSVVISDLITAIINPNARRWTSVGKSGIDEGHRIVQTCNLTYSRGDFRHGLRRHRLRSCGLREAPFGHIATGDG